MANKEGNGHQETFSQALKGKKIPVLTLDKKWYQLFMDGDRSSVAELEKDLNTLLKQQGKVNTETKDIKRLKKKLMGEIVALADEAVQNPNAETEQKIDQNKKLVEECNERLESYQDELLELPRQIEQANEQLMLATMDCCYEAMHQSRKEAEEIEQWVSQIRVELKKRLIRKQELEQRSRAIYSYMHDVFGAEVIDLFDMSHEEEMKEP